MRQALAAIAAGPRAYISYAFGPTLRARIETTIGLLVLVAFLMSLLAGTTLGDSWETWRPVTDLCALDDPRWCLR